jgi:HEAT repeat protein
MLESKDYYVKQYALDALRKFDSILPSCVSELLAFFAAETDCALRCAVLKLFTQKKIGGHYLFFAGHIIYCECLIKNSFYDYIGETLETGAKDFLVKSYYAETDPKVRSKIVKTIALLKYAADDFKLEKETLFDFLNDSDARVRANACSIRADFNNIIIRAEFKKLLNDASNRVNADAAVALYKAGDGEAADYIAQRLSGASDKAEKSSFIFASGAMNKENNYAAVKTYLSDGEQCVRRNAIISAGRLKSKEAIPDLLDLYMREQKQCRENLSRIIMALKSIDEFDSTLAIIDKMNEAGGDEFARATLVKVLAHFVAGDMSQYIVSYLDDADARVRANSIEAICFLKERGVVNSDFVVKKLLVSMCDSNSRVVANSVRALYAAGVVSVISVLREMLLSNVETVRGAARHVVSYFPEGLMTVNG